MKKQLLLLSPLFLAHPVLSADESLTECRQIEAVVERVLCYDTFVDSHIVSDSTDAESLFGKTDAEAKRLVETSLDIDPLGEIEAIVTDVRRSSAKRLTVLLDNGQIWRQIGSERLALTTGDAVIVRKASLSSYLLEKQSGSRSIRVKRAN